MGSGDVSGFETGDDLSALTGLDSPCWLCCLFELLTSFFHTIFLPDLTQVYLMPATEVFELILVQEEPCLMAPDAGETCMNTRESASTVNALFI